MNDAVRSRENPAFVDEGRPAVVGRMAVGDAEKGLCGDLRLQLHHLGLIQNV